MKDRSAKFWYAIYAAAAFLVLLYLYFPSEALRAFVAQRVNAGLPGLTVAIGGIRPALPVAVMLEGVQISHGGTPIMTIEELRISTRILSLFQDTGRYTFSGSAGGGEISGAAETDATGAKPFAGLTARLDGAQLEKITALQTVYGSRLSGRLTLEISSKEPGSLTGRLAVTEAQVELGRPLFDLKTFSFRTVEADLNLLNRSLVLRNGRLKGAELDAEIAGTIALDPAAAKSALNLSGRVVPHQALVARMEGSLPPNFLRRRGGLAFKLTGSLDDPGFSLN
jgi:type II secretion system protein N